jgi:predicted RNase H-like nuclease (RuvC/YqgF family)
MPAAALVISAIYAAALVASAISSTVIGSKAIKQSEIYDIKSNADRIAQDIIDGRNTKGTEQLRNLQNKIEANKNLISTKEFDKYKRAAHNLQTGATQEDFDRDIEELKKQGKDLEKEQNDYDSETLDMAKRERDKYLKERGIKE